MERTENTVRNVAFSMLSECMLAVLKFVSRFVFVHILGKEYLGLDGLFTDILTVLSLAELGFSVSITYSLYRPVAEGDQVFDPVVPPCVSDRWSDGFGGGRFTYAFS